MASQQSENQPIGFMHPSGRMKIKDEIKETIKEEMPMDIDEHNNNMLQSSQNKGKWPYAFLLLPLFFSDFL